MFTFTLVCHDVTFKNYLLMHSFRVFFLKRGQESNKLKHALSFWSNLTDLEEDKE